MEGNTLPLQLLSPLPDITAYNDNNKPQLPQKMSVQEYIPIYNTKFISLLRQTKNTDTTAINTIANTIIDLFKSHHTHNNKESNNIQTYYNNYYNNTDEYDDLKQLSTHTIKTTKLLKTAKLLKTDNKSLLKYSIECMLNSSNSTDIIFYNIYIQDLICVISFLSNLGYILSNDIMDTDNIANNPCNPYNPFMLAYTYLLDLGVSPTICELINNLLYINIDNYKNNNILNYNNIQIKSLEQLKNIEHPEYNNDNNNNNNNNNNDNNDNYELLNIIHNCMNTRLMNIYEHDINLYLNGYVKHKLIKVLTWF